ncbi:hypothetical protein FBU30_005896 [Linnemannia zychae]|nr:hypothetical protein FBU30_005896 [Linnemannia zychae]
MATTIDMNRHATLDNDDNMYITNTATGKAFHPVENDPSVTVFKFTMPPPIVKEEVFDLSAPLVTVPQKEAFFHICLDISGSMSGSGLKYAKLAMKELFTHLIETCNVDAKRISVYLFESRCTVRQMGKPDDIAWMDNIRSTGGTSFANVFKELITTIRAQLNGVTSNPDIPPSTDVSSTIFFLTDGADMDQRNTSHQKELLEPLLKNTPRLESTVHSFGFTNAHDAKLLSWLTSIGTDVGCFQFIKESKDIQGAMEKTASLLDSSAMKILRKIDLYVPRGSEDSTEEETDWVTVKLDADDVSGSTVIRSRSYTGSTLLWREHVPSPEVSSMDATVVSSPVVGSDGVQEMSISWLTEDDVEWIGGMTTYIQHELLGMSEQINSIDSSDITPKEKRTLLEKLDSQTEIHSKCIGTLNYAAARIRDKATRESSTMACSQTRSILQSFMSLKADAHKNGGSISHSSLSTFNSLAYGQITETRLKAKLDSRAGKNTAAFADLDRTIEGVVKSLDLDKLESEETEEKLRELSCAFSTNSYVDALRDGDCLCMTLDVSRSQGAIADPSQLVIKSILPTYLTSSMFTTALGHSLSLNHPENVHGGFNRHSKAKVAPGLAHENITAIMPLYINEDHWKVARLRMKPILGYVVTLDATGYTYSQSTTVPFLVLAKALEASHSMTEFKERQFKLILETCDVIYRSSKSLQQSVKPMVEQFCASHTGRTVDVVTNNYVFLGHVICALRAGDISKEDMDKMFEKFETSMVEEQIRRDMSWRVSDDMVGGMLEWFGVDRQRDIVVPGQRYRDEHDTYVKNIEKSATNETDRMYRELLKKAQIQQSVNVMDVNPTTEATRSPTAVTSSLSVSEGATDPEALQAPEFKVPVLDPVAWELTQGSLDRLSLIKNAVAPGADKIRRMLQVVHSPLDGDLHRVLTTCLGAVAPTGLADEFFSRYSPKIVLATLLQAHAHTRNSDRRSVEKIMTPFERRLPVSGEVDDKADDEAIQFLYSLYQTKMSLLVSDIVNQVENAYLESKKSVAASIFVRTSDLDVAAGVLLESKTRGGAGGPLVRLCARMKMVAAREKIQMMLTGTYNGVKLFSDCYSDENDVEDRNMWYPCRKTLLGMFRNHHEVFSLNEWRSMHPVKYVNYFAYRYVLEGCMDELTDEEQKEVRRLFDARFPRC